MIKTRSSIHDVAARANVSHQTVSRVLNHHVSVSAKTKAAVLEAMALLDYQPNRAAQSLSSQRAKTLGVVGYGTSYYGPAQMLAQIEQASRARGYAVVFIGIPELNEQEIQRALLELRGHFIGGILLIAPLQGVNTTQLQTWCAGVPVLLIDTETTDTTISSVTIDQRLGAQLAAKHLIDLGHQKIAFITGPQRWNDAQLRLEGWQLALDQAGLQPLSVQQGDWSPASGFALTQELLASRLPMTALLIANDSMALGALWALHERGIAVPHDISVIGFDDIPESRFFHPPLTTVQQDFKALGLASLETLLDTIESRHPRTSRVIVPQLITRASTAPVKE